MKQTYRSPIVELLSLADEDILTSSPLSTRNSDDPIDNCSWNSIIGKDA